MSAMHNARVLRLRTVVFNYALNMMRLLSKLKKAVWPLEGKRLLEERLSQKKSLGYFHEDEAFEAIQLVKRNTMLPYEELVSLYEQVVYCEKNNILGAFVECGVWKGGAAGLMASASLRHGNGLRSMYLFDAFDDICEPNSVHDDQELITEVRKIVKSKVLNFEGRLNPLNGIYKKWGGHGTLEECQYLFSEIIGYPSARVHYVKGWFQETVAREATHIPEIAILRLDGDWYESTRVCLEAFYPLLSKGGICIIDDYGYNSGCKKAVDEYLRSINSHPLMARVGYLRYWIKV